jgi:mono/diheme cytochrome c family protein
LTAAFSWTLASCAVSKREYSDKRAADGGGELDGHLQHLWRSSPGRVTVALTDSVVESSAMKIIEENCFGCHGAGGIGQGGITNITDKDLLIRTGKVVPGKPEQSPLYLRAKDAARPMPPRPAKGLDQEKLAALHAWIIDLAKASTPDAVGRTSTARPRGALSSDVTLRQATPGLAAAAKDVLQSACASCHGSNGLALGGLTSVTDVAYLIQAKHIVPGRPAESRLVIRAKDAVNPMPPPPAQALSAEQVKSLEDWITDLGEDEPVAAPAPSAPSLAPAPPSAIPPSAISEVQERRFVTLGEEFELALDDLRDVEDQGRNDARDTRYLSLVPLYNAGQSDIKLKEHANALSRTLNHLSTRSRIAKPVPLNAEQTIFRINIRDYGWSSEDWRRITREYPYKELVPSRAVEREFRRITGEQVSLVRADWLALHATQPEFYNILLDLPNDLRGAERTFRFDLSDNLAREAVGRGRGVVMRSGFMKSGVSLSNRVIERHEIDNGAFWISYDFQKVELVAEDQRVQRLNIFSAPLGPRFNGANSIRGAGDLAFDHSAGEVIATLPNGLFWYLLANNNGNRVDNAPTNIVADPSRPEGIINGYSCMRCHAGGLLPKDDEVRDNIDNLTGLSRQQRDAILNLYPPKEELSDAMERDNARFLDAIAEASLDPGLASPSILSLAESYESFVTAASAAAELGLDVDAFKRLVEERVSRDIQNQLSPLLSDGGLLPRALYEPVVDDLLNEIIFGRRDRDRRR